MEAQVHILCSHCEKVLVEVPKEKQVGNVKASVSFSSTPIRKPLQRDATDEVIEVVREINIDYSNSRLSKSSTNQSCVIENAPNITVDKGNSENTAHSSKEITPKAGPRGGQR